MRCVQDAKRLATPAKACADWLMLLGTMARSPARVFTPIGWANGACCMCRGVANGLVVRPSCASSILTQVFGAATPIRAAR